MSNWEATYNQNVQDLGEADDYAVGVRKIDWNSIPSKIATEEDIQRIKMLESNEKERLLAPDADVNQIFSDKEESLRTAIAFLKLLEMSQEEKLQYILTMLSHLLQNNTERCEAFLNILQNKDKNHNVDIFKCFDRIWNEGSFSTFTKGKAAICGGYLLRNATYDRYGDSIMKYFDDLLEWILQSLKSYKHDSLIFPLQALKAVVINVEFQELFVNKHKGIDKLRILLENHRDHRQVVYLAIFVLWVISFSEKYCSNEYLVQGTLIKTLIELLNARLTIKVIRVILGLFENLLNKSNFNEMVVLFGLFNILRTMNENEKFDDDEIKLSIKNLLLHLEKDVKILSSFERYVQELKAQKLSRESPVHNEQFWKKFANKFDDNDFKLIKDLIALLGCDDDETVELACQDLGDWSRFYPEGKRVVEKLGGKNKAMMLLNHTNDKVRKQALLCVQKLLITNWQAIDVES